MAKKLQYRRVFITHRQTAITALFYLAIVFLGTFLAGMAGYTVTYLWEKHNAYSEQKQFLDWQNDQIKQYNEEHPNGQPPILGYPQGQEKDNGQPYTF